MREMQIKTATYDTPGKMAKIQGTDIIKCCRGCGALGILSRCWWECRMAQPLWSTGRQLLTKLYLLLPYGSVVSLLGIYPTELKTHICTETCHMDVCNNLIHNCQNLEATSKWINPDTPRQWNVLRTKKKQAFKP